MGRTKQTTGDQSKAVAYLRTSTEDQNLGPEAQRAQISAWAERAGVEVIAWHEDRISGGKPVDERPALMSALDSLRQTGAGLLVAAKRDRIARDVVIAATVEALAAQAGARVLTADGVSADNTPEGALMRGLLDLFAQYERALIRARTKAALQAKKARGARLGRPPVPLSAQDEALIARVRSDRSAGKSWARIALSLQSEGATLRGSRPHVTALRRLLAA